jgi:hypothetical protein
MVTAQTTCPAGSDCKQCWNGAMVSDESSCASKYPDTSVYVVNGDQLVQYGGKNGFYCKPNTPQQVNCGVQLGVEDIIKGVTANAACKGSSETCTCCNTIKNAYKQLNALSDDVTTPCCTAQQSCGQQQSTLEHKV